MRAFSALLLLSACRVDADGDGLTRRIERELGLDPKVGDTDGDGLSDGEESALDTDPLVPDTDADRLLDGDEVQNGADPLRSDSDGDGYLDGDEVREGTDPSDAQSVIYEGGWPYYFGKDDLASGPDRYEFGKRFLRLRLEDQYGDVVDLYDFYNADRPVVLHVAALWNGDDYRLGAYIRGEGYEERYSGVWAAGPEVVARGDVYWLTVLVHDLYGGPATPDVAVEYASYFAAALPTLADATEGVISYVNLGQFPTVALLDPQLRLVDTGDLSDQAVLAALNEQFPE